MSFFFLMTTPSNYQFDDVDRGESELGKARPMSMTRLVSNELDGVTLDAVVMFPFCGDGVGVASMSAHPSC